MFCNTCRIKLQTCILHLQFHVSQCISHKVANLYFARAVSCFAMYVHKVTNLYFARAVSCFAMHVAESYKLVFCICSFMFCNACRIKLQTRILHVQFHVLQYTSQKVTKLYFARAVSCSAVYVAESYKLVFFTGSFVILFINAFFFSVVVDDAPIVVCLISSFDLNVLVSSQNLRTSHSKTFTSGYHE